MTALEPISNSTNHQAQKQHIKSNNHNTIDDDLHLQSSETLLNSDLLSSIKHSPYSPLISSSTSTKIDLFRKYKQQIVNTTSTESLVPGNNSASFEDLKTYSTPPQSPPFALLLRSSPAPLSPLITSNFSNSAYNKNNHSQSNLMVNEDSKHTSDDENNKYSTTTITANNESTTIKLDNTNLEQLHSQIKQNNKLLKEKLKSSYDRFKSIQTKYFHTHVAEQLNKILELKEKQKNSTITTTTTTNNNNNNKQVQVPIKEEVITKQQLPTTQIDDNSVDLLTSILKSNLNNHTHLTNTNSNVDVAVKSLLDDIKYEILKQTDDKRQQQQSNIQQLDDEDLKLNNSDTDNENDDDEDEYESNITTTSILTNDQFSYQYNDSVFDDVDLALEKLKNVNTKKQHQKSIVIQNESTDFNLNESIKTTTNNQIKQQNEEKKLIDSSNLFWNMNKSQLSTNWECVQTKLKYLKLKQKQCNDYTNKCNRLINVNNVNSNNNNNTKTVLNQLPEITTTTQTSITTNEIAQEDNKCSDEAAIAALSSSLQESVAAAVVNTTQTDSKNTDTTNLIETGLSASRCIPFKNNLKSKSHSRLFNLNRNDLIKLDDDVIRSLYFSLKYFSNNYFKTMCSCSQLNRIKRNLKQKSFNKEMLDEAKVAAREIVGSADDDELINEEDEVNDLFNQKKRKKSSDQQQDYNNLSLSDLLSMNKTCIFCHLLKEYEKTKMNEINLNNKNLIETKFLQNIPKTNSNLDLIVNNNQDDDLTTGSKLADLNVVRNDHSYCKQSINQTKQRFTTNINSTNNSNGTAQNNSINETNELLERLVNDRLNRIFNTYENGNSKCLFEKFNSKYEETDEMIDAGLDLTPNDLQNLPDLSYDELKFLNELDDSCSNINSMRKFNNQTNDNLDDIDICDDLISSDSLFLNQTYPFMFNHSNKNHKLLTSSFTYKPKYKKVLKQSSNKNSNITNKKRKIETTITEINKQTNVESTHSKRGRKQSCTSINSESKRNQTKKFSSSLSSSSSSSLFTRQKRNRSASSSTTTSSSSGSSFNDSSSNDQSKSSAGYYYNYYVTNSQNKFDIDNIVIPHDMVSNNKSVHIEQKHVPTPRWRVLDIEPLILPNSSISCREEEIEPLDDSIFIERHKQKEHDMIVNRSRIFKKNKSSTRSLSTSSTSASPPESSTTP